MPILLPLVFFIWVVFCAASLHGQYALSRLEDPDKYTFQTAKFVPTPYQWSEDKKTITNPDFFCSACAREGRIKAQKRSDLINVLEREAMIWEEGKQVKRRFGQFKLMEEKGDAMLRFLFEESEAKDPIFIEDGLFRLIGDLPSYSWAAFPPIRREEESEALRTIFPELPDQIAGLNAHQRTHLYLIRAHRIRRDIEAFMGVRHTPMYGKDWGPYLGAIQKFELYLFAGTRKPMQKYLKFYTKYPDDADGSWDVLPRDGSCVLSAWVPDGNDFYLNNALTHRLSHQILRAFGGENFEVPTWYLLGFCHLMERRERTDYNTFLLSHGLRPAMWREANWKRAIKQQVLSKRLPKFTDWINSIDPLGVPLQQRGLAFSQVSFMMQTDPKKTAGFIWSIKSRKPGGDLLKSQIDAFERVWGMTPEQFEAAWIKWVLANY